MSRKYFIAAIAVVALVLVGAGVKFYLSKGAARPVAVGAEQKAAQTKSRVETIGDDLTIIRMECGKYPDSLEELVGDSGFCSKSCPQVECLSFEDLRDSWDKRIEYFHDSERLTIRSLGKDGREGGVGEDADAVAVLPMNPE